jgi:hypothetical protein
VNYGELYNLCLPSEQEALEAALNNNPIHLSDNKDNEPQITRQITPKEPTISTKVWSIAGQYCKVCRERSEDHHTHDFCPDCYELNNKNSYPFRNDCKCNEELEKTKQANKSNLITYEPLPLEPLFGEQGSHIVQNLNYNSNKDNIDPVYYVNTEWTTSKDKEPNTPDIAPEYYDTNTHEMTQSDWRSLQETLDIILPSEVLKGVRTYPFMTFSHKGIHYNGQTSTWFEVEQLSAQFNRKTKGKHLS